MQLTRAVCPARTLNGQVGESYGMLERMMARATLISVIAMVLLAASLSAEEARAAISGKRAKVFAAEIAAFGPRVAGSSAERLAGDVVVDAFGELGYRVRKQAVPLPVGGRSRNIIARSPGPLRVIVLAHLDGVSAGPAANDNGSGVAVMLELARALRGERGLLLAAVGAEERIESGSPIHLGSARLARALAPSVRKRVRLAVSLDMVGVGGRLAVRGIEDSANTSATQLLNAIRATGRKAVYERDSGVSDHAEFTRAGVPAAWLQYRFDQACWHQACDTADRLKTWKLRTAGRVTLRAVRSALFD
jgi:hypothetical protein